MLKMAQKTMIEAARRKVNRGGKVINIQREASIRKTIVQGGWGPPSPAFRKKRKFIKKKEG